MDLQEQQKRKREQQLATSSEQRALKRAGFSNPPTEVDNTKAEAEKVVVETTRYSPTIPDYATKIEFGDAPKNTPIAAYNRFKVLSNARETAPSETLSTSVDLPLNSDKTV
jgi:hypothetical protein